jgi:hypothetical protein
MSRIRLPAIPAHDDFAKNGGLMHARPRWSMSSYRGIVLQNYFARSA